MSDDDAQNSHKTGNNSHEKAGHLVPYRWQPGESGNPGGRPKRKPISEAYAKFLEFKDDKGLSAAELIAQAMIMQALKGNVQAVKEITDRVEGTLRQSVDVVFGSMTDEELKQWIAGQFTNASGGADGGDAPGFESGGDPAGTAETDAGANGGGDGPNADSPDLDAVS